MCVWIVKLSCYNDGIIRCIHLSRPVPLSVGNQSLCILLHIDHLLLCGCFFEHRTLQSIFSKQSCRVLPHPAGQTSFAFQQVLIVLRLPFSGGTGGFGQLVMRRFLVLLLTALFHKHDEPARSDDTAGGTALNRCYATSVHLLSHPLTRLLTNPSILWKILPISAASLQIIRPSLPSRPCTAFCILLLLFHTII